MWGRVGGVAIEGGIVGGPVRGKEDEDRGVGGDGQLGVQWTVAYYIALTVGAVMWWKCLWLMTDSRGELVKTESG